MAENPTIPRIGYDEDDDSEGGTVRFENLSRRAAAALASLSVPPGAPHLVVVGGRRSLGKVVRLHDKLTVGRGNHCDLLLEEDGISRTHARVSRGSDGSVWIEDLGSSNGVILNGKRLAKASVVTDGARFHIGDAVITMLHFDGEDMTLARNLVDAGKLDPQTRVLRRDAFVDDLTNEHRVAVRCRVPLSVALVGIVDYRSICLTHGTTAGPYAIRQVASHAATIIERNGMQLGRYADHELAIMLPEATTEDARAAAQAVIDGVSSLQLIHEGRPLGITLGAGVACSTDPQATSASLLLQAASYALARAMQRGGHLVEG